MGICGMERRDGGVCCLLLYKSNFSLNAMPRLWVMQLSCNSMYISANMCKIRNVTARFAECVKVCI